MIVHPMALLRMDTVSLSLRNLLLRTAARKGGVFGHNRGNADTASQDLLGKGGMQKLIRLM